MVGGFPGVGPYVYFQHCGSGTTFPTDGTNVRFFPCVSSHVNCQTRPHRKRLVANLTNMRFFASVDSQVGVQMSRLGEPLKNTSSTNRLKTQFASQSPLGKFCNYMVSLHYVPTYVYLANNPR